MNKILKISIWAILPLLMVSCKKDYLETNPSTDVVNTLIFQNTTNAKTALEGMYRITFGHAPSIGYGGGSLHADFGQKAYDIVNDLMGNDMVVHLQGYGWFNTDYQYTASQDIRDNRRPHMIMAYYYTLINNANNIIVNIGKAEGPDAVKESMKGQSLALRAFAYYNLVNYFQQTFKGNESALGVPLYLVPAIEGKARSKVQDIYTQINADLVQAELLLTGKPAEHKSHIDVKTVQGIRARVALTMEDWATAATYAAKARTGYTLMSTNDYKKGFNSVANSEWMWGAEVIVPEATIYASFFSHVDAEANGGVTYAGLGGQKKITKDLFDKIDVNDVRYTRFKKPGTGTSGVPDYCQIKFRLANPASWAGDYLFMRASEMYLIEAEAQARLNNNAAAISAIEALGKSRLITYTAPTTNPALLDEILLQRRIELWGEGFSWFDIKRLKTGLNRPTGAGNHGSPSFAPGVTTLPAGDRLFTYLFPQKELNTNPYIVQNP